LNLEMLEYKMEESPKNFLIAGKQDKDDMVEVCGDGIGPVF
jgi:hypothetical protein